MPEKNDQEQACTEASCKEDLFQGLMSLFAQAEEAEQTEKTTTEDWLVV